jgi:hypothetical protein
LKFEEFFLSQQSFPCPTLVYYPSNIKITNFCKNTFCQIDIDSTKRLDCDFILAAANDCVIVNIHDSSLYANKLSTSISALCRLLIQGLERKP